VTANDPVSWLLVEPGWSVVASDGTELGRVHDVVGDSAEDIFNGLAVSPGRLKAARYVPAERVASITEGQIRLELTPEEFDRLDEHGEPPPSERIRADTTDL
jgi:uncharacterized protein YrrD